MIASDPGFREHHYLPLYRITKAWTKKKAVELALDHICDISGFRKASSQSLGIAGSPFFGFLVHQAA
jgi:hypothetical protein